MLQVNRHHYNQIAFTMFQLGQPTIQPDQQFSDVQLIPSDWKQNTEVDGSLFFIRLTTRAWMGKINNRNMSTRALLEKTNSGNMFSL